MKARSLGATTLSLLLGLSGCADLEVTRLLPGGHGGAQSGPRYFLPMTTFDITITRRVAECVKGGDGSQYTDIRIATEIDVEARQVEDPDAAYVIDLRSLSNMFNATSTQVQFFDGTNILHTVNAKVEDRTGPAVVAGARAVASVAGLVAGLPVSDLFGASLQGIMADDKRPSQYDGICAQLATVNELRRDVVKATELVAKWTLYVELLAYNPDTEIDFNIELDPPKDLVSALEKLREAERNLAGTKRTLGRALAQITHVFKTTWPTGGNDNFTERKLAPLPQRVIDNWYGVRGADGELTGHEAPVKPEDFHVSVEMVSLEHFGRNYIARDTTNGESTAPRVVDAYFPSHGIRYRSPVQGRLIFRGKDMSKAEPKVDVLKTSDHEISQLGYIDAFAVRSRPFESAEYSLVFSKSGRPVSMGYKEDGAPVEGALSALTGIVAASSGFIEARDKERAERRKAESDAIDAAAKRRLTELQIAERELALNDPEDEVRRDSIKLETEIINAQIALIEAQQRYEALNPQ